jgi:hypothetical protein
MSPYRVFDQNFECFFHFPHECNTGPEKVEMEPGQATNLGPPHHSKSHVNILIYLINILFKNQIFCHLNIANEYRWKTENSKLQIQLNGLLTVFLQFTPWGWALLEKPQVVQLLKNFPTFYGTRRFNTVITRAPHWSLSWVRSIQSIPRYPI